ncbi:hypothetical protein [Terracoccus sp. 273MFTsu3.1]|uniref:hypothetical protein n=1 Tax=Terracoccus sp. 273MFTsu3.1 TaxID=1172188 RepID=UPI0003664301|nr:hypothetical protein [Terracoccus sp. 273MFTsu3.1]
MTSHPESLPGATAFRTVIVVLTVLLWLLMVACLGSTVRAAWTGDLNAARALALGWGFFVVYTLWDMAKYIREQVRR